MKQFILSKLFGGKKGSLNVSQEVEPGIKWLVLVEDQGFFLGFADDKAIWSEELRFPVTKAFSFDTQYEAVACLATRAGMTECSLVPIETETQYVSVEQIIKLGYGKHVELMFASLPSPSDMVH